MEITQPTFDEYSDFAYMVVVHVYVSVIKLIKIIFDILEDVYRRQRR